LAVYKTLPMVKFQSLQMIE